MNSASFQATPNSRHVSQQRLVQIAPLRIFFFDQRNFPFALPVLDLLFLADRGFYGGGGLEPDKMMHTITVGEAVDFAAPMFENAANQVIGHANIERSIFAAGHQVNEVIHPMRSWNSLDCGSSPQ